MHPHRELQGLRVLVTRPADQAEPLCRLIAVAGGEALRLPTLEIRDPDPREAARLDAVAGVLETYDLAVFISVNAVTRGMDFIRARRAWPVTVKVATVGASSAQALARYGPYRESRAGASVQQRGPPGTGGTAGHARQAGGHLPRQRWP